MGATFADTLLDSSGSAVSGAIVKVTPLEASDVDVRPVTAFSDGSGAVSLSIPAGVDCRFWIPALGIDRVMEPTDGETHTIADLEDADGFSPEDPTWLP